MPSIEHYFGIPGEKEIERLADREGFPSVSLLIPAHPAASGGQENRIRLGNLLAAAEDRLRGSGTSPDDIAELLEPARELLRDGRFSRGSSDGLAIYLHPASTHRYRVPLDLENLAFVGERYQVTPLIPILPLWSRFHVLALSQNRVRLFEASGLGIRRMEVAGMPASLAEAVDLEDKQQALQFHTGAPGNGSGSRRAMYHGHGGGKDDREKNLAKLCRKVDANALRSLGSRDAPLVVAAEEQLFHLYRRTSKHPLLFPRGLIGNPDDLDPEALRRSAWSLALEHLNEPLRKDLEKISVALHHKGASTDLNEILTAAREGRVDVLSFSTTEPLWGRYDHELRSIRPLEPHIRGAEDLVNLAAVWTLRRGGSVHALPRGEIPEGAPVAALFRY
jgi:hypothetical protein